MPRQAPPPNNAPQPPAKMRKLVWRVSEAPTGKYRSFYKRQWPSANWVGAGEQAAICLYCEKAYYPQNVKTGDHPPITIRVAEYRDDENCFGFTWRTLKKRASTLTEAKELAQKFLENNPNFWPKKER